jgi:hypothetical protein
MTKKGQGGGPGSSPAGEGALVELHNRVERVRGTGRRTALVRRMIIAAFVVMAVVGLVVGLIGLLTHYW